MTFVVVHDTLDAALERRCIEIQQQPDAPVTELQIGKQLRGVHRQQVLDRFDLNDDVINQKIDAITGIKLDAFVMDWKRELSRDARTAKRQLVAKADFVARFEQAGPELSMDLERRSQNALSRRVGHKKKFTAENADNTEKNAQYLRSLRSLRLVFIAGFAGAQT